MISVVTPTLRRPAEVAGLLANLSQQILLPHELVLVDGAPAGEKETEEVVAAMAPSLPFRCRYLRHRRGTAIQRNEGIDASVGAFVAFIDDDVRLEPDFFQAMMAAFTSDKEGRVGGIVGYRTNQHFKLEERRRWRWYRRLRLLTTFEPGHYDFECGYPINACMQPPFSGVRKVEFMTTSCAVWRREVFDAGLRFDPFFRDYGMLEDAHFSLRAGRQWELLQCGDARCIELHSPNARSDRRTLGYKCVVNYHYVFRDIVGPLTWRRSVRFWRFQVFELLRVTFASARHRRRADLMEVRGRLDGFLASVTVRGAKPAGLTSMPTTVECGSAPRRRRISDEEIVYESREGSR